MRKDVERQKVWEYIHTDIIQFAFRSATEPRHDSKEGEGLNRSAFEAIRYSHDAIEAVLVMVLNFIETEQLGPRPNTWLFRHINRKWRGMSLEDKIGMLTYAWANTGFWESDDQRQLFLDLKHARDGLTHPTKFGRDEAEEVLGRFEGGDGLRGTVSRPIREASALRPQLLRGEKSVANFSPTPTELTEDDAKKAVEIMLLHLLRVEEVFFERENSQLCIYDPASNGILTPRQMLALVGRHFAHEWSPASS